jgi:hypothetical protein
VTRWVALGVALVTVGLLVGLGLAASRVVRGGLARLTTVADTLAVAQARVDTVYVDRVRTLTRTLTRWDTVRVTDTVVVNGVVYVPRIVADSAIDACRQVVVSCDARVAIRDARLAVVDSLRVLERQRPWTAAGLTYGTGGLGIAVQRDAGRLRLGLDAHATGARVGASVRW